jgi:hypothetical protein
MGPVVTPVLPANLGCCRPGGPYTTRRAGTTQRRSVLPTHVTPLTVVDLRNRWYGYPYYAQYATFQIPV